MKERYIYYFLKNKSYDIYIYIYIYMYKNWVPLHLKIRFKHNRKIRGLQFPRNWGTTWSCRLNEEKWVFQQAIGMALRKTGLLRQREIKVKSSGSIWVIVSNSKGYDCKLKHTEKNHCRLSLFYEKKYIYIFMIL